MRLAELGVHVDLEALFRLKDHTVFVLQVVSTA